jgi:serine/threonine protein phosphatase 1
MRTLVIGDIHGCFTALQTLEREMDFTDEDQLITLGDYVDRGPDSKAVLDWLIARRHRGGKLIALKGNHEILMMWAREDSQSQKSWMSPFVGGDATLRSYGHEQSLGLLRDVPEEHWQFIQEQTVRYHETDTHLFVHASVLPEVPMEQQKDETLFWDRFKEQSLHMSGKRVICGHTAQHDGRPVVLPHGLCIDTRAYGGGWLTCLDMATGRYGQANQRGAYRTGQIDQW